MSEERKHHPYSPSKLEFLEVCPHYESVNSTNEKARLGVLQHAVTETGQDDLSLSDAEAAAAAECIEFFEDKKSIWVEAAERSVCFPRDLPPPVIELSEIYLPIDDERIEDFVGTTGGYLDKALIDHTGTKAMLFDWKYGMWQVTKASENLQGIAYSLGVFKEYPKIEHVDFYFKQPHINSISHAAWTRADVPSLYLRVLTVVARARRARASGNFDMANPTIPGCLFCSRIAECPAVAEKVIAIARKFYPAEVEGLDLTPTRVHDHKEAATGLRLATLVESWAKAFKSLVLDRCLRGGSLPDGYELTSRATREVVDTERFKQIALMFLTESEYLSVLPPPPLTVVEKIISDKSPRGQKSQNLAAFKTATEDAGAIQKKAPYAFLKARTRE